MHRISRAPVVSATRSRDSCWITSVSYVCQFSGDGPKLGGTMGSAFSPVKGGGGVVGWAAGPAGTGPANSLGLFEDLHDPPPLGGGERTGLHHQNPVADAARVLLVVHLQLPRTTQNLAVEGVLDAILDL